MTCTEVEIPEPDIRLGFRLRGWVGRGGRRGGDIQVGLVTVSRHLASRHGGVSLSGWLPLFSFIYNIFPPFFSSLRHLRSVTLGLFPPSSSLFLRLVVPPLLSVSLMCPCGVCSLPPSFLPVSPELLPPSQGYETGYAVIHCGARAPVRSSKGVLSQNGGGRSRGDVLRGSR